MTDTQKIDIGFKDISLEMLKKSDESICDIYVRINDEKFLKILHLGDKIHKDIFKKYEHKDDSVLYVTDNDFEKHKEDLQKFSSALIEGELLPNNEGLNQILSSMGISQNICFEVGKSYSKIVESQTLNKKITKLLMNSFQTNKRFVYDHSYLCAVISSAMAKKADWGTKQALEKLCVSSLLHDLCLDEDIASMADRNDLNTTVSQVIINSYLEHGELMGKLIEEKTDIPIEVASIIREHHVIQNPNISQMTSCFIIAHEFVLSLYNYQFRPEYFSQAIESLFKHFPTGPLNKQCIILKEVLAKE